MSKEAAKFQLCSSGENGEVFKISIEGKTEMPSFKHDLKLMAIIALLETVNFQDFIEPDQLEILDEYSTKLISSMKYALGE
jgi:hypothetical protein